MVIRPATKKDLDDLDINTSGYTARGMVVEDDNEVIGFLGVVHSHPLQCFGKITDELREKPVTLVKFAKTFAKKVIGQYDGDIYTTADNSVEKADVFLERMGFGKIKDVNGQELYQWQR